MLSCLLTLLTIIIWKNCCFNMNDKIKTKLKTIMYLTIKYHF